MDPVFDLPPSFLTGAAASHAGDPAAAAREFAQALAWHPAPEARAAFLVALLEQREGRWASSREWAQKSLAADPSTPDTPVVLARALVAEGRAAEAAEVLQQAVQRLPSSGVVWYFLAAIWMDLGHIEGAAEAAHRSVLLDATFDRVMLLGKLLHKLNRFADAEAAFAEARRLNPADGMAAHLWGKVLRAQKKAHEALAAQQDAVRLAPGLGAAHAELGSLYLSDFGQPGLAEECMARSVACGGPTEAACRSHLLLARHYQGRLAPEALFAEHQAWEDRHGRHPWLAGRLEPGIAGRRIRVGYLSPDFKLHPVAFFWDALGRHHDRGRFEVFCYADVAQPDDRTQQILGQADHGTLVHGLPDDALAARIHQDRLDILVDLAGHAGGRMGVMARKPAPVQATYLGYPDTTGLRAVDYRLVDALTDPPGLTDPFHTEKLLRLPGCFLCYTPREDAPAVVPPPCGRGGGVTFASFNLFAKLTDRWAADVAAILRAVPGSRLMLKSWGSDRACATALCHALFAPHGIGPQRLRVLGEEPTQPAHLARYGEVDIALDTFPYHGTTTTCEALWMGVPVVTLAGETHVSRVGVSLLTAVGLSECVARTPQAWIAQAVALAGDPRRLADWRGSLRSRMQTAMHGPTFARRMEAAYQRMIEHAQSNGC